MSRHNALPIIGVGGGPQVSDSNPWLRALQGCFQFRQSVPSSLPYSSPHSASWVTVRGGLVVYPHHFSLLSLWPPPPALGVAGASLPAAQTSVSVPVGGYPTGFTSLPFKVFKGSLTKCFLILR